MLQYSTVEPGTLELLRGLMRIRELEQFYLVGGTALALYKGHRISIDLDLFTTENFNSDSLIRIVKDYFPDFTHSNPYNPVGVFGFIKDIKVDFVRHHNFPWISVPTIEDDIRLAGLEDIMAMKIAAVMKRGVKKDFWDIAELLSSHTVQDLINAYDSKYPNQQLLITIPQALTYFEDAEHSADPISLSEKTWDSVKEFIQQRVREYLQ